MTKVGIMLRSNLPVMLALELAQEADRRGLHSVWVTEGNEGRDAFTQMAAMAVKTQRILLGSGIVPIYTRSPVLTGMSTMALHTLSGGRIILGLGTSHRHVVEDAHGLKLDRPIALMRDYIEVIRKVLWETEFSYQGRVLSIPKFIASEPRLRADAPIFVAALRSQMLRLGGAVSDGVLMHLTTPKYIRYAVKTIGDSARKAGRDPSRVTIANLILACVSSDEDVAAQAVRLAVAAFASRPFYNMLLRDAGYEREMDAIGPEVERRDIAGIAKKLPDEVVSSLGVFGSPDQCRERVKPFQEAGVQVPVLFPTFPPNADPGQVIGDLIQAFS